MPSSRFNDDRSDGPRCDEAALLRTAVIETADYDGIEYGGLRVEFVLFALPTPFGPPA
jgi:hypothetical protein